MKGPEHFALIEDLAKAFGNAAVGATRAVTDEEWRPHADQIGQTGRLVSPDLYVACGISGLSLGKVGWAVMPFVAVAIVSLFIACYWPPLTLWFPSLIY